MKTIEQAKKALADSIVLVGQTDTWALYEDRVSPFIYNCKSELLTPVLAVHLTIADTLYRKKQFVAFDMFCQLAQDDVTRRTYLRENAVTI